MESNRTAIEIISDLIKINNDRVAGYKKAEADLKNEDTDLRRVFNRMSTESSNYSAQLNEELEKLADRQVTDTSVSGSLHRAWIDVKATFGGNDRHALLSSCEFGEDAIQKAYKDALANENLPLHLFQLISTQKAALKTSHDEIKRLRDTIQTVE